MKNNVFRWALIAVVFGAFASGTFAKYDPDEAKAKAKYNPQIQIFAEYETKRPFFKRSTKTKRPKKDLRTTQTIKPEIRAKITLFRALSNTIQQAI